MKEDTGSHPQGVGTPQSEGSTVLDWAQVVSLDGKGSHERLNLITSDQVGTSCFCVPVDGEGSEIVTEGGSLIWSSQKLRGSP